MWFTEQQFPALLLSFNNKFIIDIQYVHLIVNYVRPFHFITGGITDLVLPKIYTNVDFPKLVAIFRNYMFSKSIDAVNTLKYLDISEYFMLSLKEYGCERK